MTRLADLAALLLAAATPAGAQPAFDCAKADGSAEEAICQDENLAALDRELARLYGLAQHGDDMTGPRTRELRATQRGWIKGRNECWKAGDLTRCIADEYAMRIDELRSGFAGAGGDDAGGGSVGPFTYACAGMAEPVRAVFVNVGAYSVSLRWGEEWLVLERAISASGARYTLPGDQTAEFWIKGNDAMFTRPGTARVDCRTTPGG